MTLLIDLETVTVYRGETDRKGNATKSAAGSVGVVFSWSAASMNQGDFGRRESSDSSPEVFTPRGADLRARDRIERSNGERYAVLGHPMWWQPGGVEVFGSEWIVFKVEAING